MNQEQEFAFAVSSIISHKSLRPIINLTVGAKDFHAQLTAEQATQLAFALLAVTEAAMSEMFIVHYMRQVIGFNEREAAGVLENFRRWRATLPQRPSTIVDDQVTGEENLS